MGRMRLLHRLWKGLVDRVASFQGPEFFGQTSGAKDFKVVDGHMSTFRDIGIVVNDLGECHFLFVDRQSQIVSKTDVNVFDAENTIAILIQHRESQLTFQLERLGLAGAFFFEIQQVVGRHVLFRRLPKFSKEISSKEAHKFRLNVDVVTLHWQQVHMRQEVFLEGRGLTIGQIGPKNTHLLLFF